MTERRPTMKLLVALLAGVALCAGSAIPRDLVPRDNSHYVEGVSRYLWMPGGDGNMHLVDLQADFDGSQFNATKNAANTQFWLYTRSNRNNYQLLVNGNVNSVTNSNYNANKPTKVISHGWVGNGGSEVNTLITSALLDLGDVNVIVVDWRGVAGGSYMTAASSVPAIGNHVGNFINWLFNNVGGNFNQLHLIGFSLGAHLMGNAGRILGGKADRVTGLDPAGPLWHGSSNALNQNSGQHVESIHTEGAATGIFNPISHADFYPNGGKHIQPGCGIADMGCSHGRSYQFFASSVRTNHFVGNLCSNIKEAENSNCNGSTKLNMGNNQIGKRGKGIYGLKTGNNWPF